MDKTHHLKKQIGQGTVEYSKKEKRMDSLKYIYIYIYIYICVNVEAKLTLGFSNQLPMESKRFYLFIYL